MTKKVSNAIKLFLFVAVIPAFIISCGGSKEVTKKKGETLIENYCSGPEYFSDGEYFRANNIGESVDQSMAKRKAMSNARADMAGQIEVVVSGTIDNYFESHEVNNTEEAKERYEGITREVFRQKLNGVRTICEKFTRTDQGKYKCYVAIELAGDEIMNAMNQRLSQDAKTRLDYDYEKFKETYQKEMEEMKNQKGY